MSEARKQGGKYSSRAREGSSIVNFSSKLATFIHGISTAYILITNIKTRFVKYLLQRHYDCIDLKMAHRKSAHVLGAANSSELKL